MKHKYHIYLYIQIIHNNITLLKPLIKWSGGKQDELNIINKYLPENYETYIEPFVGGGSVFFHINPVNAIISDVHKELIDFYKCIKHGYSSHIYDFMQNNNNDETTYYNIRDNMDISSTVNSGTRFYYLRKTCFRGMMRYNNSMKFNVPFGKYKTVNYDNLLNTNYEILLKRTKILNRKYEYIFSKCNDEKNFVFLDPPYDSAFTDYGYCSFDRDEHIKLANIFKSTRNKCLMILGKTDFTFDLYKDYIADEYDKKYKFKLYNNRIGNEINAKHLVIKNY